ncbi:MAG: homoserine dehydrogenase [Promethearchaeota archaeon]
MNVKIGLIGKGNVGTSFLKILKEKKDFLKEKFNLNYKVIAVFEYDGAIINETGIDLEELLEIENNFRELPYWNKNLRANEMISKLDIDIYVETTPTNHETGEPALSHIINALSNGIDVVSSNKGPFYLQYNRIINLAKEKGCFVKYEGVVASCVPALSISDCLIGNNITNIRAILNGTCNYILSRMSAEGITLPIALKEAQELGYAEADPTLDIEGFDAAGKLVILANKLFGWSKTIKDVKIRGITKITSQALDLAKSDGFVIKHLALVENDELIVEPRLIEKDSPLNISGTFNVIELNTKYAGPIVLIGRGAGGFEAASAILNDIINIAKNRGYIHNLSEKRNIS